MRRRTAADVDYDVAGDTLVRPEDEDALGVRRGELAAVHLPAGDQDNMIPLVRRRVAESACAAPHALPAYNIR